MNKKSKILRTKLKVRFQDCDPFGHLNNGKYIDYFMNAREDQLLENYGINVFDEVKNSGRAWVVSNHMIAYIEPVGAMDEIIIDSQLIHFNEKSISIEFRMYDVEKKRLKSTLWTSLVLIDLKTKKATAHNDKFMNLFKEVIAPIQERDFQARVKVLRSHKVA